jgi:hypothetical protein
MIVELHFEDGFAGETIEVLVDGEVRATFRAKTRYQVNLARVEPVDVKPAHVLAVRVKETGTYAARLVDGPDKYFVVSNRPEGVSLTRTDEMPKHL